MEYMALDLVQVGTNQLQRTFWDQMKKSEYVLVLDSIKKSPLVLIVVKCHFGLYGRMLLLFRNGY